MFDLTGMTALVTGASGGIGSSIARSLAQQGARLALSGEDAHDLVVTAPVAAGKVLRAKIEAIAAVIALIVAPLLLLIGFLSPVAAGIAALGIFASTASATATRRVTAWPPSSPCARSSWRG